MPVDKQQFQLPLTVTKCRPRKLRPPQSEPRENPLREPVAGIDQVLSTRDVERITGRHRCTIYRWVCAGTFPEKRAGSGRGWLRSDVERWLHGARQSAALPEPRGRWTTPRFAVSMRVSTRSFYEVLKVWSERRDLNSGPLAPHASALPDCATFRPQRMISPPRGW